ncbi:MAG: hypothetical protein ACXVEI_06905 [Actinomycetota bacterium]
MRKLLVSLGLVVFLLSGCANAPAQKAATPGDALPTLLDAIQKTNEAGSGRMAIDLTFTSPKQTVHITGDVAYVMDPSDPSSLREHVVLDIPSLGMMPGGKVEMIVAKGGKGPVLYLQAPMLASFIPATTPWIKIDPSTLPQSQGQLGAVSAAANPAAILAAIKDALTVDEVGAETVDGSAATHYRASIDLVKLLPLLASLTPDKPTDAEMQKAKNKLEKLGMQSVPIDLWVDGDGFLKQAKFSFDLSKMDPSNAGTSFALTLTLSDIGSDISIDVPPASQVTDISDLLGSFMPTSSATSNA